MFKKLFFVPIFCSLLSACSNPFDYFKKVNEENFEKITFHQTLEQSQDLFGAKGESMPSRGEYALQAWQENYQLIVISYQEGVAIHKSYSKADGDQINTVEVLWDQDGREQRSHLK